MPRESPALYLVVRLDPTRMASTGTYGLKSGDKGNKALQFNISAPTFGLLGAFDNGTGMLIACANGRAIARIWSCLAEIIAAPTCDCFICLDAAGMVATCTYVCEGACWWGCLAVSVVAPTCNCFVRFDTTSMLASCANSRKFASRGKADAYAYKFLRSALSYDITTERGWA